MIEINYVIPFLTLFLGVFIGHKLALGREKRKEHNAVILPLKQKVRAYIDSLKESEHLNFSENYIKDLRCIVSERKYNEVKKLHHEFICLLRAHEQVNEIGYVVYSKEANIEISNKLKEIEQALSLK